MNEVPKWVETIEISVNYLVNLSDLSKISLIKHRRKTFVLGFIVAATSVRNLSLNLLSRLESPFNFILTYKMSQDHVELLFAYIRGKNGFNNNPDARQLKSALKRILLSNSIILCSE